MSFLDALAGCQSCAALNPGERPHRLLSLSTTMHWQSTELIQDSEAARWCFVWMRSARMPPESWYRSDKKKKKNGIFKTLNAPSCCFWEVSVSELLEIISFGVCVLFYFSSKCCSHASAHSRVWVCGVLTRRNKTSSRWRDWSDLPLRDFTPPKREEKSLFGGEREKKKVILWLRPAMERCVCVKTRAMEEEEEGGGRVQVSRCVNSAVACHSGGLSRFFSCPSCGFDFRAPPFFAQLLITPGSASALTDRRPDVKPHHFSRT